APPRDVELLAVLLEDLADRHPRAGLGVEQEPVEVEQQRPQPVAPATGPLTGWAPARAVSGRGRAVAGAPPDHAGAGPPAGPSGGTPPGHPAAVGGWAPAQATRASTSPSIVCSAASISTCRPCSRAVAAVTG